MLSKEEIENAKECLKEIIQNTYAEGKAIKLNNALEYIEQLESEKQKLTEKLEEDIKSNNKSMTDVLNYTNMIKATRVSYAQGILNFISE